MTRRSDGFPSAPRRILRGSALSWSALASILAGLGALGFLTVGRFAVGLAEFAPMAHVWTVWSVGAATVGFGSQIETVDRLSRGHGPISPRHLRMVSSGVALAFAITLIWRSQLFGTDSLFWPTVCGLILVGSLVTGVARGELAANDERRRLTMVIAGENVIRFALALIILWLSGTATQLALALLAGFTVAAIGLRSVRVDLEPDATSQRSTGTAGAVAGLIAHACLVLPPSVLALRGEDPATVAAVFLVLTYLRAPYQFLLGLSPVLTAQSFGGSEGVVASWLANARRVAWVTSLLVMAAMAFGFLAGDLISSLFVGDETIVRPIDYALLCGLVVVVSSSILRTIAVLADQRRRLALRAWATVAIIAVGFAFIPGEPTLLFAGLLLAGGAGLLQLTLLAPREGRV